MTRGTHVEIDHSVDPQARLRSLQTAHSRPLSLLMTIEGDHEVSYHYMFADSRVHGEWFTWTEAATDLAFFLTTGRTRTAADILIGLVPA